MKKYTYLLFALLFALLFVDLGTLAQEMQFEYSFTTFNTSIPPEGGTIQTVLGRMRQNGGSIEFLEYSQVTIVSYTKEDPQLISVINNGKGVFYFEFERNTTGKSIERSIVVTFECEEVDLAAARPLIVLRQATFHYTQDSTSPLFDGGEIKCETDRVYKIGEQPLLITSKNAASYAPIIIDGQIIIINPSSITYVWEKKTTTDPMWREMSGKTGLTCQPDLMDDQFVYYRRKAICGKDIVYSNTITLQAKVEFSAGIIGYELSSDKTSLTFYHTINTSASWEQSSFEQSINLKTWDHLAVGTHMTIDIPSQITYYRNVATDTDGNKYYSNVVSYIPLSIEPNFSQDQNYINTRTYRDYDRWTDQIKYYDGLGRLSQHVNVSASPTGDDIVTPSYYDAMGREDARFYLPYPSGMSTGEYKVDVFENQVDYYMEKYNDIKSYSEKIYELSSLNRPIAQINIGEVFRNVDKKTQFFYQTNTVEDSLIRFAVDNATNTLSISSYNEAKLYKNIMSNEDGTIFISFVNMFGQELLNRVVGEENTFYDTYNVYDDLGRLVWVLSPQAIVELQDNALTSLAIDHKVAQDFCYIYKYDGQNRCVERKHPGKEWEYMIYDKGDRLILTQDGNLRQQNRWIYNVYDNFSRPIFTNIVELQAAFSRQDIQNRYNTDGFDNAYPITIENRNPYKPFPDNSFTNIAVLTERRYGSNSFIQLQDASKKVIISEFFHDVPLNRPEAGSIDCVGGFVELYNCDLEEVNISNWTLIGSDAEKVFTFPTGTKIPAGGYIILSNEYNNNLLILGLQPNGGTPSPDKQIIYQQNVALEGSNIQLTLKDATGDIKDAILINTSSNITEANVNNMSDPIYMSDQRVRTRFDTYGCAIVDNTHWETHPVTPFRQYPEFVAEDSSIPDYLRPKLILGILDKDVIDNRTTGLKEYDKIAILDDLGTVSYIERAYYYDYKGRIVQIVEKNQFGGISRITSKYDFVGNVVVLCESHQSNPQIGDADVLKTYYTYDTYGHLLNEMTIFNDCEPEIVCYGYDKLGKLESKTYGNRIINKTIEVSSYNWLCFSPEENQLSDLFRDYMAEKMVGLYDVQDWEQYDYILADGSINPAYFMATESGVDYYYFPNIRDEQFNYLWEDILLPFKEEHGLSAACYTTSENGSGLVPWARNIVLKEETAITETYDYNIQGWATGHLVKQGDDLLFSSQQCYYDPQQPNTTPSYVGNISEWTWQNGIEEDQNTYAFAYDKLSRLKETEQYINGEADERFVEKGLSYDLNGNISTLIRTNYIAADDVFRYIYSGNQLMTLHTGTGDYRYEYDPNGNMTYDGANKLNLTYNHLNLIEKAEHDGATLAKYSYLSDGTKLSATDADGNGFLYLGSLVYKSQNGVLSLESVAFNGGRIIATSTAEGINYSPQYHLTDHLGSVRAIVDNNGKVSERNDYYPFGLRWSRGELSENRYRYNGKEEQGFVNLPYTDYGARMLDSKYRLSWNGNDPLAGSYYSWSPYSYVMNNPIRYIDLDGCSTHTDSLGRVVAVYNDGNMGVFKHEISADTYDGSELSTKNGTNMGKTDYWDEFLPGFSPRGEGFTIQFGESFDGIIEQMHEKASYMDLKEIAVNSAGGGLFDIKKDYPSTGRLLNGKYVSSRSAGNYLAGYNASEGTYLGIGVSFETFQKLAGALHIEESAGKRLSNSQKADIVMFGTYGSSDHNKFQAPTWGEIQYQYRMSKKGWNHGK